MATTNVTSSAELRSAIQAALAGDVVQLTTNTSSQYTSVLTLAKITRALNNGRRNSAYTVQGSSSTLASSQTILDTRIFQQNVDGGFSPSLVKDLTLSYTVSGAAANGALLSVVSADARSIEIKNVKFTGHHAGWSGNSNLYMSVASFSASNPFNVTLKLDQVNVDITGQGNNFNGTTGGSAFLHSWNNNGPVTIRDSIFDENGFASSFNLLTFGTTAGGNYTISGNTFKRTSNATVRPEGNRLGSVVANLTGNTFQDGSYLDLYGNIGSVTLNGNSFATIAGGYGIRVNDPVTGTPTLSSTNVFTGGGVALKYVNAAAGSFTLAATGGSSFTVNGATFYNLIAGGQAGDTITGNATANWISGDTGNDILTGGAGDDAFVFATALNASTNVDTITNFKTAGADKICLANAIFTGLSSGPLAADKFSTDAGVGKDVVYDSGSLFFKAGGDTSISNYLKFAILAGLPSVSAGDIAVF